MIDFATYYRSYFHQDINQFFSTIPDKSKFHEDNQNKRIFSIQYERLAKNFKHLIFLDKTRKEYFGVALFYTVLTDMVCFSHFKPQYSKFQYLTKYPKFIGNCPSSCRYHFHPRDIFIAMNKGLEGPSIEFLNFFGKFNESNKTMEKETLDFFKQHIPEIEGKLFWEKCKNEFPYSLSED